MRSTTAGLRRVVADLGELADCEVRLVLSEVQATRRALDCLEALLAARAGERAAPMPVKDLLDGTPSEVARRVKRAEVVEALPVLSTGWAEGSVLADNVDAVAATLGRLSNRQKARLTEQDAALAQAAASEPVDVFRSRLQDLEGEITGVDGLAQRERLRARRFHKKWFDDDGCLNGRYRLSPDDSVPANAALEAAMTRLYTLGRDDRTLTGASDLIREQFGADALSGFLTGAATAGSAPAGIVVVADPAVLETDDPDVPGEPVNESGTHFPDGTPLPLEVARRVLCDSDVWLVPRRRPWGSPRPSPPCPNREPSTTRRAHPAPPHLRHPRLRRPVRVLPNPPRPLLGPRRRHEPRQHGARLQPPSPAHPRPPLAPRAPPRPQPNPPHPHQRNRRPLTPTRPEHARPPTRPVRLVSQRNPRNNPGPEAVGRPLPTEPSVGP